MTPCETRLALHRAGFSPLPLFGKKPAMNTWTSKVDVSIAEIELWSKLWPHATNTGFLTRVRPVFDIDVLCQEAAEEVEALVRDLVDGRGPVLVRFGRSPKRAVLMRAAPFKKIEATFTTGERLEILADGQQLAAFGVHPQTRRSYYWFGGFPGEVKHSELPLITEAEAIQLVADAADLHTTRHGYVRTDSTKRNGRTPPDDWVAMVRDPVSQGQRNGTLARITGHLLRRFVDPLVVLELLHAWNVTRCRPPLDPDEVNRTVNSIAKRELKRRGTAHHG